MDPILSKLTILGGAAKYDASCASSGSKRESDSGFGSACQAGICHSWADDGRCISLLKVLLTNYCIYDCAYCLNRRSNSTERAIFTPEELVSLTVNFYKRNYIEGLFLSSGVYRSPDTTMEMLLRTVKLLRLQEGFHGYIHLKAIPGASPELVREAGFFADRMSINIELPSERALQTLAPQKESKEIFHSMQWIGQNQAENKEEKKNSKRRIPTFVPAGQSTQLIVGATPESDLTIIRLSDRLYRRVGMKRVYYSAYVPVNNDRLLPALITAPPLKRENRLYQADWLMRYYHFDAEEILDEKTPFLDEDLDPKTTWAIRHPEFFPVEIQTADYEALLRIPGVGVLSAKRIVAARRSSVLDFEGISRIGVVLKRARYFITCGGKRLEGEITGESLRQRLIEGIPKKPAEPELFPGWKG